MAKSISELEAAKVEFKGRELLDMLELLDMFV